MSKSMDMLLKDVAFHRPWCFALEWYGFDQEFLNAKSLPILEQIVKVIVQHLELFEPPHVTAGIAHAHAAERPTDSDCAEFDDGSHRHQGFAACRISRKGNT
jgi:hypothetical protein